MAQIWEYIKIALMNIKTNKGRSVLTMLGIIIGIASVIMIISIGDGMRGSINEELDSMAGGLIAIYTNSDAEGNDVVFTEEEFDLIEEKVEHVKGVTPQYGMWATAIGRKGEFEALLYGGATALQYAVGSEPIVKGRYFSRTEYDGSSMVCVLNENSARMLFGTTDVVGMSLEVYLWGVTQELTIVGIRQDTKAGLISAMNGGGYLQVEMPLSAMSDGFGLWVEDFTQIYVIAESSEYSAQVAADTITLLENKFNVRGENKILMESFADYQAQYDSILGIITIFISFVAGISLLVGGIGVMNI
ncbi:MAG: ABC transporter permease, partial [Lachnospiraceae bacterium]|nr:ABC transporter permease [Lachnospiraceae bacterium]